MVRFNTKKITIKPQLFSWKLSTMTMFQVVHFFTGKKKKKKIFIHQNKTIYTYGLLMIKKKKKNLSLKSFGFSRLWDEDLDYDSQD